MVKKLFSGWLKIVMPALQKQQYLIIPLTQHSNRIPSGRETSGISPQDAVIYKVMYSPNFYDFDSEQCHKIMIQEKLNGS